LLRTRSWNKAMDRHAWHGGFHHSIAQQFVKTRVSSSSSRMTEKYSGRISESSLDTACCYAHKNDNDSNRQPATYGFIPFADKHMGGR